MFDWDDLRYFLVVARTGSLSRAARQLGVTQPTMGRRMACFEETLGANLLVRTPEGQKLTPMGQRLLEHAERMEAQALAVERSASGRDAGVRGRLCINASEWVVDRVLSPLVGPLLEQHPALELELTADTRHVNLVRREADIAIRPSSFPHQDIVQRQVGRLAFGLYASDAYLARYGHPDFDVHLGDHRLIAMSEDLRRVPELGWLPKFAHHLVVVARSNGRLPMATLAACDVGLTVLPRFVGDATPRLRLVPTPIPGPVLPLWLGYHRDVRRTPRVKTAVAFLVAALERLQPALCPEDA